ILHELYTRTLDLLTGGRVAKPSRTQLAERLHAAAKGEVDLQAVKAHLAMMADRYLECTGVQRMAEHLRMLGELGEAPVVTALFQHPDLGSSDLVVVTRDLPGLFSLIAGSLAASGVNIISAQIHTRADGIAIDTLQVRPGRRPGRLVRPLGAYARRAPRGDHRRAERPGAPRPAPRRGARGDGPGRPTQDRPRQPALGYRHGDRGEVPGPARPALPHHAHGRGARARHRERADRDGDRP